MVQQLDEMIRDRLDFFQEKFNAGEITELVNGFFADNCIVTGTEVPLLKGKEAAIAVFNQVRSVQKAVKFDVVENRVENSGLVYSLVQTRSELKNGDSSAVKSLVIFSNTPAGLLCEVDFFAAGEFG